MEAGFALESAWLEKFTAFVDSELKGPEPETTAQWAGVTARLDAAVGTAPTPRTEPLHATMLEGCDRLEAAAKDGSQDELNQGLGLLTQAGNQLVALVAAGAESAKDSPTTARSTLPFDPPTPAQVSFASAAIVKRKKMSYGKPGVLMIGAGRLTFVTADPKTSWQVAVKDIAHLEKPWYGMGSYLTCDVAGAYYAFAFGRRGMNLGGITSASGLAIRFGGATGAAAGLAGDAIAVSALVDGAHLGGEWFRRLGAVSAGQASNPVD